MDLAEFHNSYQSQISALKAKNNKADEKNQILIDRIQRLQELLAKAYYTNEDLHTAFKEVTEEKDHKEPIAIEYGNPLESSNQCLNLVRESLSWINDKDKLLQRAKFLERECQRYDRDNKTLGKQVRHLLKALEEERGMIIHRQDQPQQQPRSSCDVIDNHLVTFQSIEELQIKNQKLLSLVKELSEQNEDRELVAVNEDVTKLTSEIEALKSQLEVVKQEREKLMSAFDTMLRERDLFKILLCKTRQVEHLTPEIFQRMVSIACSSSQLAISNEPEDNSDKDAHLQDLRANILRLERDIQDLQESNLKRAEEINLKTKLLEEANIQVAKETQRAQFYSDRIQVLESNVDALMKEFDECRTKCLKLTLDLEQQERSLKDEQSKNEQSTLELSVQQERNEHLSGELEQQQETNEQLNAELEDLKANISRLEGDIEDLHESNLKKEEEYELKSELLEEANLKVVTETQRAQALESDVDSFKSQLNECQAKCLKLESNLPEHIQLTTELEDFKANISRLERDIQDLQESNLKRAEEINLKTKLLEEANIQVAKETQRAQVYSDRIQVLESNVDALMKEFDECRTKCLELTSDLEQRERSLKDEQSKNEQSTLELSVQQERNEHLSGELEQQQETNEQLNAELEDLKANISRFEGGSNLVRGGEEITDDTQESDRIEEDEEEEEEDEEEETTEGSQESDLIEDIDETIKDIHTESNIIDEEEEDIIEDIQESNIIEEDEEEVIGDIQESNIFEEEGAKTIEDIQQSEPVKVEEKITEDLKESNLIEEVEKTVEDIQESNIIEEEEEKIIEDIQESNIIEEEGEKIIEDIQQSEPVQVEEKNTVDLKESEPKRKEAEIQQHTFPKLKRRKL